MENKRIIATNFFSQIAADVLRSCIGQLSDGWGENNPANDKWWRFADVEYAANGQVIISISTDPSKLGNWHRINNGFYGMSDAEVLAKFAGWAKKTMQMELKGKNAKDGWKRNNTSTKTFYLNYKVDINVAQVYCIYEDLLGRSTTGKYSDDVLKSVYGQQKSEEETKHEEAHRAELKANDDKRDEAYKSLANSYDSEKKQIMAELNAKLDALNSKQSEARKAVFTEWEAKKNEINQKFSTTK